ncbi:cyclic nucleotide-binding protein [Aeromonas veronii]|uniref:Crp/Fnr family transcriptional regulator n=1 Tax=Aeromonas veronii TaxID=654 RepID=UPI0007188644|nr:Crp/Fnr family transcriptional regulator [Aeromonas veronii]KRV67380.1 cyclic nucleotide-binding protein [Aeromonas veronii]KRV74842.1 cyclic nucleotide-binding protein [Aeromonas veronii]KRV83816.1 cyclic nucleotide-binding protein [Aeromonas veronii]KRV84072.1 cyclic nucleotide-binding protein [Aeromonas veronii]MCO4172773.1 Crp/Fnr family transcriptional regulator [Aeromonas veronii]
MNPSPQAPSLTAFLCTMGLDAAQSEAISLRLPRQTLRAGQALLAQGAEQEAAFYIEAGIARACHYTRDGQERCKEFYFEGELCLLYDSWLTGSPARYQLEALTELQVVRMPLTLLDEPAWQPVCMALLRLQLGYKERKEAFLLLHSPEERYRELCHTFPHWPARLTQVQLANYIGISPVTLSRIRRRINTG